ncbi:MAG: hypothetical protein ACKOC6_00175, partial [bacterium]
SNAPTGIRVDVKASWQFGLSFNGTPENTGGGPGTFCNAGNIVMGTASYVLMPGDNVVMIRSFFGDGYGSILDAQVTAINPTPTIKRTWGALKLAYR